MKITFGALAVLFSMATATWAQESWPTITAPVQIYENGRIQVIGVSEEGQSRFAATRAAQVLAQREILEIIKALNLYGKTTVKEGMLISDNVNTCVEGFLQGAVNCGQKYHSDQRYAEVCMRLDIHGRGGLYEKLLPLMKNENMWPEQGKKYKPGAVQHITATAPPTHQSPVPVPEQTTAEVKATSKPEVVHDGLIVDTRKNQFRPALVNRIITQKKEILFDPSKVVCNILVERGCGGFTTEVNKAKALLDTWGSSQPMIVTCTDVIKLTDAQISPNDAAAIFTHDQKSNLLAQARVVFLLK